MPFLHVTLLYYLVNVFSSASALEHPPSSSTTVLTSIPANPSNTNGVEAGAANIIFQSTDGGKTWQDISHGLPENEQPEDFFAGESEVFLRFENVMYRSKSNLYTPAWEKENVLDSRSIIASNRFGVMALNDEGKIYQKMTSLGTWLPIYTNFKNQSVETVFETSDGTVFVGCRDGLYKSVDKGRNWKHVKNEGWVMDIVESEGVLLGTGQNGIMRSTDNGEHWEWVISEGGVGIAVERIDGGFAAISCNTKTNSRRIHISLDNGKTWKAIDDGLRPSLFISSIKQMGGYLICGHPDGIFRSSDLGKTWTMVHPGVDKIEFKFIKTLNSVEPYPGKVFKIYASGNVLYALARSAGC